MKKCNVIFIYLLLIPFSLGAQSTNATEEIAQEVGLQNELQSSVEGLTRPTGPPTNHGEWRRHFLYPHGHVDRGLGSDFRIFNQLE